jgi:glycerol-3-phosphate acyltransferase PlsX
VTRVAVDAMGGDNAPEEIVRGAVRAQENGCEVLLVGNPDAITRCLRADGVPESSSPRVIPATDVVTMDEAPGAALRHKKQSSMGVTLDLVRRGEADAAVSAGNSGAMMALSMAILGRVPGIERPAISALLPSAIGGDFVLLDAGANVDCSAENLLQFALMGRELARAVLSQSHPRVAILSIGEESSKGNALTKEAAGLLSAAMPDNFAGNVEGRQIYSGEADVVVCDGFVGNVTLKVAEGTAEFVESVLRHEFRMSPMRMLAARLSRPVFRALKSRTDYDQYGGAPLLGVNGVCIISHGRSNARAVVNAVREADKAVKGNVVARIAAAVKGNDKR